jgi:seryl-tRNA synthetase
MENAPEICWSSLNTAKGLYLRVGFEYIEVPWVVPREITQKTVRLTSLGWETTYGDLVGSAEQGFIKLALEGELDIHKCYQSISPCFRDEETITPLTRPYFMKLELGVLTKKTYANTYVTEVMSSALDVMHHLSNKRVALIKTSEGYDIECEGVELGSYGYREIDSDLCWVYGTGLAEPRFSQIALGKKKEE